MKKPIPLRRKNETRTCSQVVNAVGNVEVCETVTHGGEVYRLITEYADLTPEQDLALEIFWRALLADLRTHVLERVAA
jgi:hypothetical protein